MVEVGDIIEIKQDFPRLVEMKEGHEGAVKTLDSKETLECEVVVVNDTSINKENKNEDGELLSVSFPFAGKEIGVKLPNPPKGHRWFDSHECDGATDKGYGWWITPDDIVTD